jgi:hypothetical protein
VKPAIAAWPTDEGRAAGRAQSAGSVSAISLAIEFE